MTDEQWVLSEEGRQKDDWTRPVMSAKGLIVRESESVCQTPGKQTDVRL